MSNILIEADEFVPVDYTSLLNKLIELLQQQGQGLFKASQKATFLTIHLDQVAQKMAESAPHLHDPLGTRAQEVRVATVYFGDSLDSFIRLIKKIQQQLEGLLQGAIGQAMGEGASVHEYLSHLLVPLSAFTGQARVLGLSYPFNQPYNNIMIQGLSLQQDAPPLLSFHKLTIQVNQTAQLRELLANAIGVSTPPLSSSLPR